MVGAAGVAADAVCVVASDVTATGTGTGTGSEFTAGIESMAGAAANAACSAGSTGTRFDTVDTVAVAGVQRLALRVAVAGIAC